MHTNATCLLLAALACGPASTQAQPSSPHLVRQPNSQLNNQVNTGSAVTLSVPGISSTGGMALPLIAPHCAPGATIGRSGTTTQQGTIDNRAPAVSVVTTSITNPRGCSTSPDANGSSTVNNVGTWGLIGPNNVAPKPAPIKPDLMTVPGSVPAGSPTGPTDGGPAGR